MNGLAYAAIAIYNHNLQRGFTRAKITYEIAADPEAVSILRSLGYEIRFFDGCHWISRR